MVGKFAIAPLPTIGASTGEFAHPTDLDWAHRRDSVGSASLPVSIIPRLPPISRSPTVPTFCADCAIPLVLARSIRV